MTTIFDLDRHVVQEYERFARSFTNIRADDLLSKLDNACADDILSVLNPAEKTIIHIPNVNSRESAKDKIREVEHIIEELGDWQGTDPVTGFQVVKTPDGLILRIADLVDDDATKRDRVSAALKDLAQKNNCTHVDIIIAVGMAKEGFDWIWCEHVLTVGYRASLTEIVPIIGRTPRDAPGKAGARFLVPRFVVDDAVERIKDGTITEYVYDAQTARLVLANDASSCGGA